MKPEEAIEILKAEVKRTDWNTKYVDAYKQALQMGADALEKLSYLTDRPCEVCKFNEDGNGCKKWNCVFEEVDDGQAESN